MLNWFKRKKKDVPKERPEESAALPEGLEEGSPGEIPPENAAPQEFGTDSPADAMDEEIPPGMPPESAAADVLPEEEEPDASDAPTPPDSLEEEAEASDEPRQKGRFFKRLRERLKRTREQLANKIDRLVLGKKTIDLDLLDQLEEVLITSDLGVKTTQTLLQKVTERIKRQELKDPEKLREQLRDEIREILSVDAPPLDLRANRPEVVMVIGVNGVGKTTTVGKLAHQLKADGLETMLVAGDTFRAAAVEQLVLWGERSGVPVVRQKSGSDPSAVAFDAMEAALARGVDVVLLDTAGRMHTKVNLMEELKKVQRVIGKKIPSAPHEILLVLDASTGQNALSQARLFKDEIGITGLILTKLDGTAKGGIIVAICDELKVPVRYIGIGEGVEDLRPFDPEEFAAAIL
jgi:fused signal recognition particle receptor